MKPTRYEASHPYLMPLARAISQLNDRAFLTVFMRSMFWAAGILIIGVCLLFWIFAALLPVVLAGLMIGVAGFLVMAVLLLPLAVIVAALMLESIARAVENRFYLSPPPLRGLTIGAQAWEGVMLAGMLCGLSLLSLFVALLLPLSVSVLFGWFVSGWALGRGLFMAVAMRRRGRSDALILYKKRRTPILIYGVGLAFCMSIPGVNLLATVLGVAIMVHLAEGDLIMPERGLLR